jgi:hypothetical protein
MKLHSGAELSHLAPNWGLERITECASQAESRDDVRESLRVAELGYCVPIRSLALFRR